MILFVQNLTKEFKANLKMVKDELLKELKSSLSETSVATNNSRKRRREDDKKIPIPLLQEILLAASSIFKTDEIARLSVEFPFDSTDKNTPTRATYNKFLQTKFHEKHPRGTKTVKGWFGALDKDVYNEYFRLGKKTVTARMAAKLFKKDKIDDYMSYNENLDADSADVMFKEEFPGGTKWFKGVSCDLKRDYIIRAGKKVSDTLGDEDCGYDTDENDGNDGGEEDGEEDGELRDDIGATISNLYA